MNKETILQKAQQEKDERELAVKVKAYEFAGKITLAVIAFVALFVAIDGGILETGRNFDYKAIAALMVGVGVLYFSISDAYLFYGLKSKRKLFSAIFFACFFIYAAVKSVMAFI